VRTAFYVCGALAELCGIVLVASPDLVPGAVRFIGWWRPRWRRIENRIRLRLRLKPRPLIVSGSLSATAKTSGSLAAIVSTGATTVDEKVEYLLRRDRETQQRVNDLAMRLENVEAAHPEDLAVLRDELHRHFEERLGEAQADYRAARIAGAALLMLGLGLTTGANFLSSSTPHVSRTAVIARPVPAAHHLQLPALHETGGQILREWLIAVGTIGAALAALYIGVWRDRWRRPQLSLKYVPLSVDPLSTDQVVVDDPPHKNTSAYVRLRVLAKQDRTAAEGVEVMVTGARALVARPADPPITEPKAIAIDGMSLQWSYASGYVSDPVTPRTIPSGAYRHVDLLEVRSLVEYEVRPPLSAIVAVRPFPGGERSMVTAGEFEVDLAVTASNAPPKRYRVTVSFNGDWDVATRGDIWTHLTVSQPVEID
jgi:hypothetical protein